MARLKSFLAGRWGFVLALAALALVGGNYYLRVHILDKGLKVFDHKGDMVLVVSPEDHARINRAMVETAWQSARRHPALNDIRFIIYVDKRKVLDQFGKPPEMDIYLGNVYLPPEEVEALRRIPSLKEAFAARPIMYLDWEWVYHRKIVHLAADPVSAPAIPRDRNWTVSVNWVLFNMLTQKGTDFRWTQRFEPGWTRDPHLMRADPALAALDQGPLGVSPADPQGELVFSFDFGRPWAEAYVRDIHTAWDLTESAGLQASVDGRSWRTVYLDRGGHRRRLMAARLTPEIAGGEAGAEKLYLRFRLELKTPSARSRDDIRGAGLSFADLTVRYAK